MAGAADDQGLPPSHRHEPHPRWFLPPSRVVEVCELANVVDLDALLCAADFAAPRQQASHYFVLAHTGHGRSEVYEDSRLLPPEQDAPNCATSGFLSAPRGTMTRKHVRGPSDVSVVAL